MGVTHHPPLSLNLLLLAYKPFFSTFDLFAHTIKFLTPKERDIQLSHDVILKTKLALNYTYHRFFQRHLFPSSPSRNPHHPFKFLILNTHLLTSSTLHIVINPLTYTASSVIMNLSVRFKPFAP